MLPPPWLLPLQLFPPTPTPSLSPSSGTWPASAPLAHHFGHKWRNKMSSLQGFSKLFPTRHNKGWGSRGIVHVAPLRPFPNNHPDKPMTAIETHISPHYSSPRSAIREHRKRAGGVGQELSNVFTAVVFNIFGPAGQMHGAGFACRLDPVHLVHRPDLAQDWHVDLVCQCNLVCSYNLMPDIQPQRPGNSWCH